jgi:hypothetical protein
MVMIPLGPDTRGLGSHTVAALWKEHLQGLLRGSDESRAAALFVSDDRFVTPRRSALVRFQKLAF